MSLDILDEKTKEKIKKLFKDRIALSRKSKEQHQKIWWRNLLFYAGHQWIKWDKTRWRNKALDPRIPQPVTNKFASSADAMAASLAKVIPLFTYVPAGRDSESRATASVCHHVTPIIYEETEIEKMRSTIAAISVMTGNAFLETGYDQDDDSLGTAQYTSLKCTECGYEDENSTEEQQESAEQVCPACGGPMNSTVQDYPFGKCTTEVLLPFGAFPNPFHPNIKEWFIKGKLYETSWAEKVYGKDKVKGSTEGMLESDQALRYTAQLMSMASMLDKSYLGQDIGGVPVYEMWQEPDEDFPDGFYSAHLHGDIVEYIDFLPDKNVKGKGFIPFSRFGFKPLIGSFWHKSGVDDLAPKQKQRNEMESLVQLICMTMASPQWLKPQGCNVGQITGLPGDQITYSPLAGAKPERIEGKPPHVILINLIQQFDKDFEELGATFDILKGEKPSGVRAGYALQVLTERALARYAPIYREHENAWEQWNRQILEIFRVNATEDRLKILASKTSEWEVHEFNASMLQGDVSIQVEAGTGAPKSQLLERLYVKELLGLGLINPRDPREKMLILEKYGMKHLATVLDRDMKDVLEEEDIFKKTGSASSLRFSGMLDNHQVHYAFHRDFAKGDIFRTLDDIQQQGFLQHIRRHWEQVQMQQQQQQQMGPGAKPQGMMKQESGLPKEASI